MPGLAGNFKYQAIRKPNAFFARKWTNAARTVSASCNTRLSCASKRTRTLVSTASMLALHVLANALLQLGERLDRHACWRMIRKQRLMHLSRAMAHGALHGDGSTKGFR